MRAHHTRSLFVAALVLTLGVAGCAAGSGTRTDGPRGTTTRIIRAELEPVAQLDLFQAVQQLRPNWLRPRAGQTAQVLVDGNRQPGGLDNLRQYRAAEVEELRFLSSSDATTRYGTGFDGGAILITTRR